MEGNLLTALQAIIPLAGKRILDLGSGTGRMRLLLREQRCEITSVDLHHAMLMEQKKRSDTDVKLIQADIRCLPLVRQSAEVVIAGWAIGHFTDWYPENWKNEVQIALAQMHHAIAPGGAIIILETMGTGNDKANPPNEALAQYYSLLENEHGFDRKVVATDYDFGSVDRAAELCGFFFGDEMADKIRQNRWQRVPEWTGIWSRITNRL